MVVAALWASLRATKRLHARTSRARAERSADAAPATVDILEAITAVVVAAEERRRRRTILLGVIVVVVSSLLLAALAVVVVQRPAASFASTAAVGNVDSVSLRSATINAEAVAHEILALGAPRSRRHAADFQVILPLDGRRSCGVLAKAVGSSCDGRVLRWPGLFLLRSKQSFVLRFSAQPKTFELRPAHAQSQFEFALGHLRRGKVSVACLSPFSADLGGIGLAPIRIESACTVEPDHRIIFRIRGGSADAPRGARGRELSSVGLSGVRTLSVDARGTGVYQDAIGVEANIAGEPAGLGVSPRSRVGVTSDGSSPARLTLVYDEASRGDSSVRILVPSARAVEESGHELIPRRFDRSSDFWIACFSIIIGFMLPTVANFFVSIWTGSSRA